MDDFSSFYCLRHGRWFASLVLEPLTEVSDQVRKKSGETLAKGSLILLVWSMGSR